MGSKASGGVVVQEAAKNPENKPERVEQARANVAVHHAGDLEHKADHHAGDVEHRQVEQCASGDFRKLRGQGQSYLASIAATTLLIFVAAHAELRLPQAAEAFNLGFRNLLLTGALISV